MIAVFYLCDSGNKSRMDVIDGEWIKARLGTGRGSKADLARAMGVRPDVVSKILNGTRRVQPREIPKVVAYFRDAHPEEDELTRQLLLRIEQLDDEERRYLLAAADGFLAQRTREEGS